MLMNRPQDEPIKAELLFVIDTVGAVSVIRLACELLSSWFFVIYSTIVFAYQRVCHINPWYLPPVVQWLSNSDKTTVKRVAIWLFLRISATVRNRNNLHVLRLFWNIWFDISPCIKLIFATKIVYPGALDDRTDCSCGVWCRGLATCILYVNPPLGTLFCFDIMKNTFIVWFFVDIYI